MNTRFLPAALALLVAACASTPPPWVEESPVNAKPAPAPSAPAPKPAPRPATHTVQKGDTVFSIAWRYGMDYHELARINGIDDAFRIYPGQVLRLHAAPAKPALGGVTAGVPKAPVTAPAKPASPKPASPASAIAPVAGSGTWQWPVRGKLIDQFNANVIGPKGIGIAGNNGDPVRAARDGRVVYTGSGLVGYGQLVIVKHDDVYLSAYAHNSKVLVKEGDQVKAGDVIAEMGSSGTDRTELHFEVRRNGDPIDPLTVLPKP